MDLTTRACERSEPLLCVGNLHLSMLRKNGLVLLSIFGRLAIDLYNAMVDINGT